MLVSSHFTDEELKAQASEVLCPRLTGLTIKTFLFPLIMYVWFLKDKQ